MRALVRLRLPDGHVYDLAPGDLIGRVWHAALCLDDPGVSEAHALVSLRGREFKLLGLRGMFLVDDKPSGEVALRVGQRIGLARDLDVEVVAVELPDEVLGVESDEIPRQVLAGVSAILLKPSPHVVARAVDGAPASIWNLGDSWRVRVGSEPARPVAAGDEVTVGSHRVRFVAIPLADAGRDATRRDLAAHGPMKVVAQFDAVHLHREGWPVVTFGGMPARLLTELVAFDGPVPWEVLSRELWPDEPDRHALRRRLDVTVARLRARLRDERVRSDLLRADGSGCFQLVLYEGDSVEDRA